MKKDKSKIKKINRKKRVGLVVRKKMQKTAIVEIERLLKHPYYHKRFKSHRRMAVDDKKDLAKVGDRVEIEECRKISKTKSWKIIDVLN
ncbi:MAG: 30S ribosomal protein S17 [Candidatus Berkelbacteria bacterium]|nr:30S ribosomal protein S17 [Candidatus Berkelbacteria bacterium]